jgi:hypothetical protein
MVAGRFREKIKVDYVILDFKHVGTRAVTLQAVELSS